MEANEKNFLQWRIGLWIALVVLLVIGLWYWGDQSNFDTSWQAGFIASAILVIFLRWAIFWWYKKFVRTPDAFEAVNYQNPYKSIFFGSVNVLSVLLLAVGFAGAFLLIFSNDGSSHTYEAIGLLIIVIWAIIFLRYFIWAVYFYNINYGLTDHDWARIFKAKEDMDKGLTVDPEDAVGPDHNPYRSQTFGLPPGTVRGMIAFTLLFGAIGMLVVSMGMNDRIEEDSFFWDHFEFFKTAFLMMIAFYFGERSLKYLQKRWPANRQKQKAGDEPDDEVGEDDAEFAAENDLETGPSAPKISPANLKKLLSGSESEEVTPSGAEKLSSQYIQIPDNTVERKLTNDAIRSCATDHDISFAVMKAVIEVESKGEAFLSDGRPKILFEGHKFWYWLKQHKKDPEEHTKGNEDILYPRWTREYYLGGTREYDRFKRAFNLDPVAAVYATSWGMFQVLGENFSPQGVCFKERIKPVSEFDKWQKQLLVSPGERDSSREELEAKLSQYYKPVSDDPHDFITKQGESEYNHLLDFLAFIKNKKVSYEYRSEDKKKADELITGTLIDILRKFSGDQKMAYWEAFAYGYNGSGFKTNHYHTRLQKTFEKYEKQ